MGLIFEANTIIFQANCTLLKAYAKQIDAKKTILYTIIVKAITI